MTDSLARSIDLMMLRFADARCFETFPLPWASEGSSHESRQPRLTQQRLVVLHPHHRCHLHPHPHHLLLRNHQNHHNHPHHPYLHPHEVGDEDRDDEDRDDDDVDDDCGDDCDDDGDDGDDDEHRHHLPHLCNSQSKRYLQHRNQNHHYQK